MIKAKLGTMINMKAKFITPQYREVLDLTEEELLQERKRLISLLLKDNKCLTGRDYQRVELVTTTLELISKKKREYKYQ